MKSRRAILALLTALHLGGCTRAAAPEPARNTVPPRAIGDTFLVTVRYYYEDGDRLSWRCGRAILCVETIVRDERMQREIDTLEGATVTLRVERISACGPGSSQVACIQSSDRTAIRILEWVRIEPARR